MECLAPTAFLPASLPWPGRQLPDDLRTTSCRTLGDMGLSSAHSPAGSSQGCCLEPATYYTAQLAEKIRPVEGSGANCRASRGFRPNS